MKILYAIQGTGNGHLTRACEIIPILQEKGKVDILISGTEQQIRLPFPVTYKLEGLGFVFGKKGGIDLLATYKKSRLKQFLRDVKALPVEEYDLIISDFEPVSAWACYVKNRSCVGLSHQSAVIHNSSPRPDNKHSIGRTILKSYAPVTVSYGFHFERYSEDIWTPVIRTKVRLLDTPDLGHYTVYLPAYSDQRIVHELSKIAGVKWEIFSKHVIHAISSETIKLYPISDDEFLRSMSTSAGVICGAGFETPAEAMFLGKKLMVIPMKNQYEQHCNAAALKQLGVPVIKSLKQKNLHFIEGWITAGTKIKVNYPQEIQQLIDHIIELHAVDVTRIPRRHDAEEKLTVKKLRSMTLKKIVSRIS